MRDIESYTSNYIKNSFEDYQVEYRRKKVIEILNKYKHNTILEIGCGMKPLFAYLDGSVGGYFDKYYFIEPSATFYENAVKQAGDDKRIEGRNALFDADILGDDYEKLDYIVCSSLLHEVENPRSILNDISKICDTKTVLHVNVPNANSFHRLLAYEMGIIDEVTELTHRNKVFQQNTVFDMNTLEELVCANGFDVIEEGSYFIKPFTHEQMYKLINDGIIDEPVLEGLYKMEKYLPNFGSEIYINARLREQ